MCARFHAVLAAALIVAALGIGVQTQPSPKKLLFLTHAGLYKHPSLGPAEKAVVELGKSGGFEVTTAEGYRQDSAKLDMSFLTPEYLGGFDGLMLMTNGNLPFTEAQKAMLVEYVRGGKAIIGAHCATLTLYNYTPFGEMLGGYYLRSIQTGAIGVLKNEVPNHPATRMLGPSWPVVDEFYMFGTEVWDASRPDQNVSQVGRLPIPLAFSRSRVRVLLSLETDRSDVSKLSGVQKGGDYPQAWDREFGKGRIFYTSLGHREDIWSNDPVFRAHVQGGIRWSLRLEE
jgi:hypothetical protein